MDKVGMVLVFIAGGFFALKQEKLAVLALMIGLGLVMFSRQKKNIK